MLCAVPSTCRISLRESVATSAVLSSEGRMTKPCLRIFSAASACHVSPSGDASHRRVAARASDACDDRQRLRRPASMIGKSPWEESLTDHFARCLVCPGCRDGRFDEHNAELVGWLAAVAVRSFPAAAAVATRECFILPFHAPLSHARRSLWLSMASGVGLVAHGWRTTSSGTTCNLGGAEVEREVRKPPGRLRTSRRGDAGRSAQVLARRAHHLLLARARDGESAVFLR